MPVHKNEYNLKAVGGTELSIGEFEQYVDAELLSKFQIIPSRFRGLQEGLIPVMWVHDTADDPEMNHLADGGWKKFRALAFVSNWQMQRFIDRFQIPWSRCVVLPNAIEPVSFELRNWTGTIDFVYHTTPHRGLNVLAGAFAALSEKWDVHLHVYSSFAMYGAPHMDEPYRPVFDALASNPKVTLHGAQPLEVVRERLRTAHVFLYPCTWPETGCRSLIEAMCHGLVCIHSNFGCLYETSLGLNRVYQYTESLGDHANIAYQQADAIMAHDFEEFNHAMHQKAHRAMYHYDWNLRGEQWNNFLKSLL